MPSSRSVSVSLLALESTHPLPQQTSKRPQAIVQGGLAEPEPEPERSPQHDLMQHNGTSQDRPACSGSPRTTDSRKMPPLRGMMASACVLILSCHCVRELQTILVAD